MSPIRLRPLAPLERCQLWLVDLDAPASPGELDGLAGDEVARAGRFIFPQHRDRFRAGRAALREVLSRCTGTPPGRLALSYGPHGKPFLAAQPDLAFNMSHSGGLGLVAVSEDAESIGVDIEVLRPLPDAMDLARANFEPEECEELQSLAEPARSRAFLLGWTRKEACLKALGSGFSGPGHVPTGLGLAPCTAAWAGHRASLHSIDLPDATAVAALARLLPSSPALRAGQPAEGGATLAALS